MPSLVITVFDVSKKLNFIITSYQQQRLVLFLDYDYDYYGYGDYQGGYSDPYYDDYYRYEDYYYDYSPQPMGRGRTKSVPVGPSVHSQLL